MRQHGCDTRSLIGTVVGWDKIETLVGHPENKKGLSFR